MTYLLVGDFNVMCKTVVARTQQIVLDFFSCSLPISSIIDLCDAHNWRVDVININNEAIRNWIIN